MPGFTSILLALSAAFGGLISIFTWYIFNSINHIYKTFQLKEIKLIYYGFTSFFISSLFLFIMNTISLAVDITMSIPENTLKTINEISYIFYNLYLIIGLMLLITSYQRTENLRTGLSLIFIGLPFGIEFTDILRIMSTILIVELIIFTSITIRNKHKLFSSSLWIISQLLIMTGRLINLIFPGEFTYIAVIYFDLFAFTSLVLMMLEAKEKVMRSEI